MSDWQHVSTSCGLEQNWSISTITHHLNDWNRQNLDLLPGFDSCIISLLSSSIRSHILCQILCSHAISHCFCLSMPPLFKLNLITPLYWCIVGLHHSHCIWLNHLSLLFLRLKYFKSKLSLNNPYLEISLYCSFVKGWFKST